MARRRSRLLAALLLAAAVGANAQLKMNVGQSGQKFTVLPDRPGLNMSELIFVDLDNDGADDLLVGGDASYGGDEVASFFLLLSHRIRPQNSAFDLATQQADRRYDAAAPRDFNDATRLAKGDWNDDGREDVAIAGRWAGGNRQGAVYVIFGSDSLATGTVQTLGSGTVDVYMTGSGSNAYLGSEMTTGDVNGDGRDDLLIKGASDLYILFGGSGFAAYHNQAIDASVADVTYSSWGRTLGVGDVNQDGRDDLFYGNGDTNRIYFAKAAYSAHEVIDTAAVTADVTTLNYGGWTGPPSFNCTDFNGDGMKDFVIVDDGEYEAVWGRTDWGAPATLDLETTFGVRVRYEGYYGGDQTDTTDLNGDGIGDLVVGEDYTGRIHVVFGRDFGDGVQWNVEAGPEKDDILLHNGGYHFATWVRFGDVLGNGETQIGSGAWAVGPSYAGIIHVCFIRPDLAGLQFQPTTPTAQQDLTVVVSSGWEEGQTFAYRWLVNDVEIAGQTGVTLPRANYVRDDVVTCEVTATLAGIGSSSESISAVVANTPPDPPVSVSIQPAVPTSDDDLSAVVSGGSDPDGDPIQYAYQWYVDGAPVGTSETLSNTFFVAGQTVSVEVRCSDGVDFSDPRSASVLINNSPTAVNDAQILSISMPATVAVSGGFQIRVTVRNTGTSAWSSAFGFRLLTNAPNPTAIYPGALVKPGDTYEFSGYCSGYAIGGKYTYAFQMDHSGSGPFGNVMAQDVIVSEGRDAQFENFWIPQLLDKGQACWVWAEIRNTGTAAWSASAGDYLAAAPGSAIQVATVRPSNTPIGTVWLARFAVETPADLEGHLPIRLQMGRDGGGRYGEILSASIIVREPFADKYWNFKFDSDPTTAQLVLTGQAVRNPAERVLYLMNNQFWTTSRAYVPTALPLGNWDAEFDFAIAGGDGFAFSRVADFQYPSWDGGWLDIRESQGWAVEFDTWPNLPDDGIPDPGEIPHVAIVRNGPSDHEAYDGSIPFDDGRWRHCEIRVRDGEVRVALEGKHVLGPHPGVDPIEGERFGLTAATGAGTEVVKIDNLVLRVRWSLAVPRDRWSLYR